MGIGRRPPPAARGVGRAANRESPSRARSPGSSSEHPIAGAAAGLRAKGAANSPRPKGIWAPSEKPPSHPTAAPDRPVELTGAPGERGSAALRAALDATSTTPTTPAAPTPLTTPATPKAHQDVATVPQVPRVAGEARATARAWWKEAVVYQIYPRSFMDSDGDGIGDLNGITSKLDYLKDLGVDVLWLCPIFASPNADNGYDISDYRAIMPEFGTMADFERLVAEAKARGLRVVLDLVANHSSDEHPWFVQSRSSKDNPYRDYYVWRPPVDGREPNDWRSFFGGSAWELDPTTGEYYLHLFAKKQPDLNWDNPRVRREVHDVMRFWLDKGIGGWRLDTVAFYSKDPAFPSFPPDAGPNADLSRVYAGGPRLVEYLHEMKREVLDDYDAMTVGEGAGVTVEDAPRLVDEQHGALNMIYHFDLLTADRAKDNFFKRRPEGAPLTELKAIFGAWDRGLGDSAWSSVLLGNHDFPRMVSRFGDDGAYREPSAKLLATLLLTMKGTPYVYQGDELGMTNAPFASIEDFDDISTRNAHDEWVAKGRASGEFLDMVKSTSRDNARTPFQWDASANAGFSTGRPWMRPNPNHQTVNAEAERARPDSVHAYFKQAIRTRKDNPVLVYGAFHDVDPAHPKVFAYTRTDGDARMLVVLNFSSDAVTYTLPVPLALDHLVLGNYPQAGQGAQASAASPTLPPTASPPATPAPSAKAAAPGAPAAGAIAPAAAGAAEAKPSLELRPWEARVYRID